MTVTGNMKRVEMYYKHYVESMDRLGEELRKETEKTKTFNVKIANEMLVKINGEYIDKKSRLEQDLNDKLQGEYADIQKFLGARFTQTLTPEEIGTLDNLEKIGLSNSEMELQIDKFKENPLAIRRLRNIAKDKGNVLPDGVMAHLESFKGYDYYTSELEALESSVNAGIDTIKKVNQSVAPGTTEQIVLDISYQSVKKGIKTFNEVIEQL